MAPAFMNEFKSREEFYKQYLTDVVGADISKMSREMMLTALQEYRLDQYEQLTDAVYLEKGYDPNGIPKDETLSRLGFDGSEFSEIVIAARARIMDRMPLVKGLRFPSAGGGHG